MLVVRLRLSCVAGSLLVVGCWLSVYYCSRLSCGLKKRVRASCDALCRVRVWHVNLIPFPSGIVMQSLQLHQQLSRTQDKSTDRTTNTAASSKATKSSALHHQLYNNRRHKH